jgi:hypothetical protein
MQFYKQNLCKIGEQICLIMVQSAMSKEIKLKPQRVKRKLHKAQGLLEQFFLFLMLL